MRVDLKLTRIGYVVLLALLTTALLIGGCSNNDDDGDGEADDNTSTVSRADVVNTNADIAFAAYDDSLVTAVALQQAIEAFLANNAPDEAALQAVKDAWLEAREAYQPTEVYRFRVGPIDALRDDGSIGDDGDGPEGRINGWPLGEGFIDYVADGIQPEDDDGPETPGSTDPVMPNMIADMANVQAITKEVIKDFVEFGDDERNLSSGYHAIEFLLWGQDLNAGQSAWGEPSYTRDASAGQRPASDYNRAGGCTSGLGNPQLDAICQRRGDYLQAAADLLVDDLQRLVDAWNPNGAGNYYASFTDPANVDTSLAKILQGMGRLGFGELAGERINIARRNDSQEDEHSCFSDNTHRDIFLNVLGIQIQYLGSYTDVDGDTVAGPGVMDLLAEADADLAEQLRVALEASLAQAGAINQRALDGVPFDLQIQEGPNNPDLVGIIQALVAQTGLIEDAIQALDLATEDLGQDTEEPIGAL